MKTRIPTLLLSLTLLAHAGSTIIPSLENKVEKTTQNSIYKNMTTKELQKKVEKLSISGNLPFSMGVELMKRWSKVTIDIGHL